MSRHIFYPFYPKRILWTGMTVLGSGLLVGGALLLCWLDTSSFIAFPPSLKTKESGSDKKPLSFSFGLKETPLTFSLPQLEPEMTFAFNLPRPDRIETETNLFIRFKQAGQLKKITLPCRINLQFNGSRLSTTEQESPFWLELTKTPDEKIQATVWIETASKKNIEAERFIASPQAIPLQGSLEFPEDSPFRILGEARWVGHDVFAEKYGGKQTLRIALGAQANLQHLALREKEWIVWRDGCWIKDRMDQDSTAIARIESVDSKALVLEGWDGETHVRLSLPFSMSAPFKMRGEDIFNSIRVRSEKQISCMMEKQCLILRTGDWVIKANGRWKILRKNEEKESYKSGKINGELFVFEKIESKQAQKFITGFLFNTEKSQVIPIDLPANKLSSRKEAKEK